MAVLVALTWIGLGLGWAGVGPGGRDLGVSSGGVAGEAGVEYICRG